MQKVHVVFNGILFLLVLTTSYWGFANSKEVNKLTKQVTAFQAELRDLSGLKEADKKLRARINNLEREIRDLRLNLEALQLMDQGLGKVWSNDVATPERADSGQEASQPTSSEQILNNPEFVKLVKEEVDKTLTERREEERAERRERYTNMMQGWMQRRVDRYATELKLNDYQKEEFNKALQESGQQMQTLFSNVRSGELARDQIGTEMEKIRKSADEQVQGILYPDQYEQYKKMQSEQGNMFMRSGRRGRNSEQQQQPRSE